ncbi:MAG: C45 family autoproteolytic acyltransferase/hydrolase [Gemmataceae bacterium]
MFAADVPTYTIDLEKPEAERWAEVIAAEKVSAARLFAEAAREFERVPEFFRHAFARLYHLGGGLYRGEIKAWAESLGASVGALTLINCAYELSHLRMPRPFGCTAGVRMVDGLGLVHVRNLDWPLAGLGDATCLFRFQRGQRSFVVVGVPGQVGVLSGMLPGAYSVTINWAPPAGNPGLRFGPTFLVRDTLETHNTYEAAVGALQKTSVAASVFFTVCGTEPGQACVIERTPRSAHVRPLEHVLAQANHHVGEKFSANNADLDDVKEDEQEFSREGSAARADSMTCALGGLTNAGTLEQAAQILDAEPVRNKFTCQQMAFCPRTGDVRVWRRLTQPVNKP